MQDDLEIARLKSIAADLLGRALAEVDNPEWKFLLDKGGVKVWTRPAPKYTSWLRSRTIIQCPPSIIFQYVVDADKRNQWDKIYTTNDIALLEKGDNYEIRVQKRVFRMFANMGGKQRVYPFVSYSGVFPNVEGGFINCNTCIESPLVPLQESEVGLKINISGFVVLPHGSSSDSSIVVHFADCDPRLHMSVWEKWVSPMFSKMAPHFEVDRMRNFVRTLESPKSKHHLPKSLYPPVLPMKDLSWMSPQPERVITRLARYYLNRENASNWETVVVDRRVVVQRWTEASIVPGNDVCIKLNFKSDCWVRSMRCFVDCDKRVQWEQCGTGVVELWNDGLDHEIIEVQGGGPGRGYGCVPFSYVAHVYHMLMPVANNSGLSLLAFEERDNGDLLLAKFPLPHDPVQGQRRASYFDEVSVLFIMKSANSLAKSKVYPRSALAHTLPLSPVEYLLLESVIELRNVLEVDAWITTNNQLLRLSMAEDEDEDISGENSSLYHKLPSMARALKNSNNDQDTDMEDNFIDFGSIDTSNGNTGDSSSCSNGNGVAFGLKKLSLSVSATQLLPLPPSPTITPLVLPALSLLDSDANTQQFSDTGTSPSLISRLMRSSSSSLSRESSSSSGSDDRRSMRISTSALALAITQADIQSLPDWVFEQILLLLGARTTVVCSIVCRHWNRICKSENVWREFVKWDFMGQVAADGSSSSSNNGYNQPGWESFSKARHASKARKVIKEIDVVLGSLKGWRKRYCEYERTQICWAGGLGKFGEVATFKKQGITSISVSPTAVAIGHTSGGVSGYSLVGGNQVFSSPAPNKDSAVVCTAIKGSDIVTLYNTGVLNVYDRNTKSVIVQHSLAACEGGSISQTHAVTFQDDVVKLWDVKQGKNVWTLDSTENETVTNVSLQRTRCAVGVFSEEFQVAFLKMVDVETAQVVTTFAQAHDRPITQVHFEENGHVGFTGSKDGNLKLWDSRAGKNCLENYWHKKCGVTSVYAGHNKLVSGTTDRKVWYWDLRNTRHEPVCKYSPGVKSCVNHLYILHDLSALLASWESGVLSSWKFS